MAPYNHSTFRRSVLGSLLALIGFALPALAVPGFDNVQPAANYGTVTAQVIDSNPTSFKVLFRVKDIHPSFGIKGLVVYGPRPIAISRPDRVHAVLYQSKHGYSWWDIKGSRDGNGNGLPDSFIEPGETVPDDDPNLTFVLTYGAPVDLSVFKYALHVVEPYTGNTFFAGAQEVCARILGTVYCLNNQTNQTHPVEGAIVTIPSLNRSTTTNASGQFTFGDLPDGTYTLQISKPGDFYTASVQVTYACAGPDITLNIRLYPLPIDAPLQNPRICGKLAFSDVTAFRTLSVGTIDGDVSLAPLYDPSNNGKVFRYIGYIPGFPDRGHVGGPGEPEVYVFIQEALVPDDRWLDCSMVNRIAVDAGIGGSPDRVRTPFDVKVELVTPFTGPGIAHDYTIDYLQLCLYPGTPSETCTNVTTFTRLSTVRSDGSGGTLPDNDDIPPGWMARTVFCFQVPPRVNFAVTAFGHYSNACHEVTPFSIHPDDDIEPLGSGR